MVQDHDQRFSHFESSSPMSSRMFGSVFDRELEAGDVKLLL